MTKVARFTEADVKRLIRAAKSEGLRVEAVEMRPDGAIRTLPETPVTPSSEPSAFERWKAKRDDRAA